MLNLSLQDSQALKRRLQFFFGVVDMMRARTCRPLTVAEAIAEFDAMAREEDAKRDAEWREHVAFNFPRLPLRLQMNLNAICR